MGFLLALTALRLFPAGLFPPFYSCVDLAGKCHCGLATVWLSGGVGEGSICPVLSGLFPAACPCSGIDLWQLQDTSQHFIPLHPEVSQSHSWTDMGPPAPSSMVTLCVLPKGSWKQDPKSFWVVPGCQVSSSFSFWWWTAQISLYPSLSLHRCEGTRTLCKDDLHYLMPSTVPASMPCMQEALAWCLHALGLNLTNI